MGRRRGHDVAAIALVPAATLAFDPGGLAPFGPAKWLVVPPLVLAAVAGAVPRIDRRTGLAWAAFLAWVAVAAATGLDGLPAWVGTDERRFGALTWLLCGVAHVAGQQLDAVSRRRLAVASAATVGATGVVVIGELIGVRAVELVGTGERPVATLGSSAFLGGAMALLVPAAVGAAADATGRARVVSSIGAGLGVLALVASGARAAWVGVAVACAVFAWRHRPRPRTAAVAVAAVVVLAFATGVAPRVPDAFGAERGGIGGRLDEWRVAAAVVADHPLTGTGPEGYRIAFGAAVDDRYERRHGRDPIPDRAHDALLDVAATTGIPGLVLFLALLAFAARPVGRALAGTEPVAMGLAAGALAYGVQAFFLFPLANVDPVAWLLVGACASASTVDAERRGVGGRGLVRPLALALAASFLLAGVAGVVADRRARGGDAGAAAGLRPDVLRYRLLAAAAHEAVGSSAGLDRAIAEVAAGRRISADDPALRSEWTRLLLARARRTGTPRHVDLARRALERLATIDPRNAEVLLRLGVARSIDGDGDGAEQAWRRAERLAPHRAAASVDLALHYVAEGRRADAAAAARRALARDPGNAEALAVLRALGADDGT